MKTVAQTLIDKFNNVVEPQENYKKLPKSRKELLIQCFQAGVFQVKFTKVNGEQSTITATLNTEVFNSTPNSSAQRSSNPDTISVYAVDRDGWRSFKIDNLISMIPDPRFH